MGDSWGLFLGALATVAATAFTVLLLTLQVRSEDWQGAALKNIAAIAALAELLIPLELALIALFPGGHWRLAAGLTGTFGLVVLVSHFIAYDERFDEADDFDRRQVRFGIPVSTAVYGSLVGVGLWGRGSWGPVVVAALAAWLVFSGAAEAWLLLQDGKPRGAPSADPLCGLPADWRSAAGALSRQDVP